MDEANIHSHLSTLWNKAECLLNEGQYQQAEEKYTQYILGCLSSNDTSRTDYKLDVAYNNRGQAKYKQVKFADAIEDYNIAVSYNPKFAVPFYNRGTIRYRLGDFQDALHDIQISLKLQPNFEEAQIALNKINSQLPTS